MKRKLILILIIAYNFSFCQDNIDTSFSDIIPPSPSVASLMKYEEIPVSNYTGIPNVNIPLMQLHTSSKDIHINLSLNYHPGNVKADNVAGDTGLGWSLQFGGTISRSVRGIPDEQLILDGSLQKGKVGLYQTDVQNHINYYYSKINNLSDFASNQPDQANRYYWETEELQKYDTEHDLWQFNFMDFSGRFYIRKNSNNALEVMPLSDYRLKIINNYSTVNNNPYVPSGFTIYDDKGYRYVFDVFETTVNFQAIENINVLNPSSSMSSEKEFRSSFQLTKIYDNNNQLLVEYTYSDNDYKESSSQSKFTENLYDDYEESYKLNCFNEIKPLKQRVNSFSTVSVKKIAQINVTGIGSISFEYETGRQDNNITLPDKTTAIKKIILKNTSNILMKSVEFIYGYSEIIKKRLILKSITEKFRDNSIGDKYTFSYRKRNQDMVGNIAKDYWDNFNITSENPDGKDLDFMRTPSPQVSTLDLLQKITYPTGGSSVFLFESNQYSFVGDQPVMDFSENPLNTVQLGTSTLSFNNNTPQYISAYPKDRKVILKPSIVLSQDPNTWNRNFGIYKVVNGQLVSVGGSRCIEPEIHCSQQMTFEKNIQYAVRRNNFDLNYHDTDILTMDFTTVKDNPKEYLFGGGNRISKIGYFDTDVPQDYYENSNGVNAVSPKKEKNYNYEWNGYNNKSSGSLCYMKPLFSFHGISKINTTCPEPPFYYNAWFNGTMNYISNSNFSSTHLFILKVLM